MVDANFGATQAAEMFVSLVRASAVEAVGLLMVDPLHFETFVQVIPCGAFVRVNRGALGDRDDQRLLRDIQASTSQKVATRSASVGGWSLLADTYKVAPAFR